MCVCLCLCVCVCVVCVCCVCMCVCVCVCVCVFVGMADFGKSNKMRKISGKVGETDTDNEFINISASLKKKKIIYIYTIFTHPSARAGYDTRSIFKRSFIGLISEFSFS